MVPWAPSPVKPLLCGRFCLGIALLADSAGAAMVGRQDLYQTELPPLVDSMAEAGVRAIHVATEKERGRAGPRSRLLHAHELDVKRQLGVGGNDGRSALGTVGQVGRQDEAPRFADLHARDALVEPGDDLAATQDKRDRLPSIERAVELSAVGEPPGVVNADSLAALRRVARAGLDLYYLESISGNGGLP
jgi:hypothetical protein